MKKRIVSLLLALVMVLSLVPTTVWAAENHDGQVRVIVENTTYAKADGAAWDGTLVDKWVDLVPGSTMMDCIVSALGSYSQTGAESGYISEINGLSAGDGGAASGWMGTLNDWFTNVGFKDIKAGASCSPGMSSGSCTPLTATARTSAATGTPRATPAWRPCPSAKAS